VVNKLYAVSGLAGPETDHAVAQVFFWYDVETRADEETQRVWLQEIATSLRARLDAHFGQPYQT